VGAVGYAGPVTPLPPQPHTRPRTPPVGAVVVVGALLGLVAGVGGCGVEFLATPPANPGASTAPAEVVALAGADLVILEGSRVVLAGNASRALAGEPELSWTQREGPLVVLSNPSSPSPIFVAPLGPARLVFVLEARADAIRDVDEVVVDVVTDAGDVPAAPLVVTLPADRTTAPGASVTLQTPWTGAGSPVASARCEVDGLTTVVTDGVLQLTVAARALPCPIVVDDVVDGAVGVAGVRTAGRSAVTLWPPGTPIATPTRVAAPAVVGPGATVTLDVDDDAIVFFVDGSTIAVERGDAGTTFVAPRRPGRLTLLVDNRLAGTRGGARAVPIEVGAGAGNAAPVVAAGPDLRVRPGARFRIAPTVVDDDGDDTTVTVDQVIGLAARQAGGGVSALVAPDSVDVQTLLFHVRASDGTADSATDVVRVVVDPNADNLPPILQLPAELYVTPDSPFAIDASAARDPDAGLVVAWRVAQAPDDAIILLPTAVDEPVVTLTSGAAGERYHFTVSVVDDDGLEVFATVTVIVEEAGPLVDTERGTTLGNGTAALPFASIDEALLTASRHRFPALQLASTGTPVVVGPLPDGLGLVGGWVFDEVDGAYHQQAGLRTAVRVSGSLAVAGARLAQLELLADGTGATLKLQRRAELDDVVCAFATEVDGGARVRVVGGSLGRVVVDNASLELQDAVIGGGLSATDSAVDLLGRSEIAAEGPAVAIAGGVLLAASTSRLRSDAVGLRVGPEAVASLAGAIVIDAVDDGAGVGVVVAGGTVEFVAGAVVTVSAGSAIGVDVQGGSLGGRTAITVSGKNATGLRASAAFGGVIGGTIDVEATDTAVGVDCQDGAFDRLRVGARGPQSLAVRGAHLDMSASVLVSDGDGMEVAAGELRHLTVIAAGVAVASTGTGDLTVANSLVKSPPGLSGAMVLAVVGFAGDVDGVPQGCARCVFGPGEAVGPTGALASDEALTTPNPFVDSGDPQVAVPFDVDGRAVPQGAGPDLGGMER